MVDFLAFRNTSEYFRCVFLLFLRHQHRDMLPDNLLCGISQNWGGAGLNRPSHDTLCVLGVFDSSKAEHVTKPLAYGLFFFSIAKALAGRVDERVTRNAESAMIRPSPTPTSAVRQKFG